MAEFVERHMQEMVPEVEEMETLGLLTKEEIKKLILKRRDFEYKISKMKKEKEVFVTYTLFDIKLLQLLAIRKKKSLMDKKTPKITYSFTVRVLKRLRYMTMLWPTHPDIWNLRISFSKAHGLADEVSVTFANMIHFRGDEENVWIAWSQWEMEGRKNFDNARQILLSRAPLYHPHSLLITKEYFRLELLYIEYLKKKSSEGDNLVDVVAENREKVLDCRAPEIIYEKSLSTFDSPDLFLEFFAVAKHFPFARRLTKRIFRDLVAKFPNNKNIWKLKAQMLMEGTQDLYSSVSGEETEAKMGKEKIEDNGDKEEEDICGKVLNPKEKLQRLFDLYDEALAQVGPTFVECSYQDLFQLLNEVWGVEEYKRLIGEKLLIVFKSNADELSPDQFLLWFTLGKHLELAEKKLKKIMKRAKAKHPNCPYIQLQYFSVADLELSKKDETNIIENSTGKIGADVCMQVISNAKELERKEKLFEKACLHIDVVLSREMRVKRLELCEDLTTSREIYKKYSCMPPLNLRFHVAMIVREFKETPISVSHLRKVFCTMIEQFGKSLPCSWICLIEFERKCGNLKKASQILEEVEQKLDAKYLPEFMDYKIAVQCSLSKEEEKSKFMVVDCPEESSKDISKYEFWTKSSLPSLFDEEVVLMYSAEEQRKQFFQSLSSVYKNSQNIDNSKSEKIDLKEWENILNLIHGKKISLAVKKMDLESLSVDEAVQKFVQNTDEKSRKILEQRGEKLSTELDVNTGASKSHKTVSKEIKKIIESSETLKPEFLQQKQIVPYYLSKNSAKKKRAKLRNETKGEGWFNMKAPEKTEELDRDLQLLKMRAALDSKTKYKRNDMKKLPQYFQMGKVVDSALDFYSSRVPKKQRKGTMVEEIMNSEEVLSHQKRKFSEIVEKQEMGRRNRKKIRNNNIKNKKNK